MFGEQHDGREVLKRDRLASPEHVPASHVVAEVTQLDTDLSRDDALQLTAVQRLFSEPSTLAQQHITPRGPRRRHSLDSARDLRVHVLNQAVREEVVEFVRQECVRRDVRMLQSEAYFRLKLYFLWIL